MPVSLGSVLLIEKTSFLNLNHKFYTYVLGLIYPKLS